MERGRNSILSAGGGLGVVALILMSSASTADDGVEFFERRVRPLLAKRCFSCHGPKKQEGGLRLDIRGGATKGGESGPSLVTGKPKQSLMITAVRRTGELKMPPVKPLSASEISVLVKWVADGAVWPASEKGLPANSGGITDDDRRFWSFQPLNATAPPSVKNAEWCRSPVDRFVLARIEAAGLTPARPADRRTLIRRATLDLTGLPPTPQQVARFVDDDTPGAFARLVDELLASPAYGARWGRHWLDVVRYCDSRDARHTGQPYDVNEAWRYRDWVVDSFNHDRSYAEFVRQQIAGDYAPVSNSIQDSIEGLIATGMLVIGEWGSGDADARKMYTDIVDDQVNVISQTFMGISLSCARCHDHKFDPFSTRDYYRMAGIFFSTQIATPGTDARLMRQPLLTVAERSRREKIEGRIAKIAVELKQLNQQRVDQLRQQVVSQASRYLLALWDLERRHPDSIFGASIDNEAVTTCARKHSVNPGLLSVWRNALWTLADDGDLLSVPVANLGATGVFTWKSKNVQPLFNVNTTNTVVRVPGTIPPRSVAVHPTPTSGVAMAWKSPFSGQVRVTARVSDAHHGGNGVEWALEHDHGLRSDTLVSGTIDVDKSSPRSLNTVSVTSGDKIRLLVLPRNDNHICDLTRLELEIEEIGGRKRTWSPERDFVGNPQQGNPHSDAYGNADTWSFTHMSRRRNLNSAPHARVTALAPWLDAVARGDDRQVRQLADSLQTSLDAPAGERKPDEPVSRLLNWLTSTGGLLRDNTMLVLDGKSKTRRDQLAAESKRLKAQLKTTAVALAAREGGVPGTEHAGFRDAKVHIRGEYRRLGQTVKRGVPEILAGPKTLEITSGSGRAELARWISRDDHPLTPRVMANRIWLHHFGEGLVRTPGDFGRRGTPPTHPQLLEWLARQFIESGWSVKAMHRLMMLTSVYRQSTGTRDRLAADPENHLFARMASRRLEVEVIRDTLLSVSGRIDLRMKGPSAPRYPGGYSRAERRKPVFTSTRRTLYMMTIRGEYSDGPFVLDAANANRLVHQRTVSTTAPQALLMMNDPFVQSLARSLAARLLAMDTLQSKKRIAAVYELLFARPPEPHELEVGMGFLSSIDDESRAWEQYCHALMCSNELSYRN